MRLFSYKLLHDAGFAPNPFHGVCTLATCKPGLRLTKRVGDWIAGFTSTGLNGDPVGDERLIYLMQVSEKIGLAEYHRARAYAAKIPRARASHCVDRAGDNIYYLDAGQIRQVDNPNHGPGDMEKDTRGEFVLIGTRFYYFGSEPLVIPASLRPETPRAQSAQGVRTHDPVRAEAFIAFVEKQGRGVHAPPHHWPPDDESWRSQ